MGALRAVPALGFAAPPLKPVLRRPGGKKRGTKRVPNCLEPTSGERFSGTQQEIDQLLIFGTFSDACSAHAAGNAGVSCSLFHSARGSSGTSSGVEAFKLSMWMCWFSRAQTDRLHLQVSLFVLQSQASLRRTRFTDREASGWLLQCLGWVFSAAHLGWLRNRLVGRSGEVQPSI